MRKLFCTFLLFISCTILNAQGSVAGKWNPVLVKMANAITIDVVKETTQISDSAKLSWQKDRDPKATEEMMQFFFDGLLRKMKNTEEEYLADGTFAEMNSITGRAKKGTYTFKNNVLDRTFTNSGQSDKFTVSWENGKMVFLGDLGKNVGPQGDMKIVYEKL